jgi:3-dehydroquinate synthase
LTVRTGTGEYCVTIGAGTFARLSRLPDQIIVADRFFAGLLAELGCPAVLIEASEDKKTVAYADHVLGQLREAGANRQTVLLAVGGGIVQDMATLVASIYMRGLRWRYVPTTLTAMADSCIGGKSSLNVDGFKNLAGNIYPPECIAVDPAFLVTLSQEALVSGFAEAAKIAYCDGPDAFSHYLFLQRATLEDRSAMSALLAHVLGAKRWFVEADEHDRGERRLLNFGHTFGHALEAASSFSIPHGVAVAIGMLCAINLAAVAGPPVDDLTSHCTFLLAGVPDLAPRLRRLDMERFERSFRSDKKHCRGELHVILPQAGGRVTEVAMADTPTTMAAVSSSVAHVVAELAR